MFSYYEVSHILFIYLVGRVCILGIFGLFVLLVFFFFFFPGLGNFFFSPLKEARPPFRNGASSRRQSSLWSPSQCSVDSGLRQSLGKTESWVV